MISSFPDLTTDTPRIQVAVGIAREIVGELSDSEIRGAKEGEQDIKRIAKH